MDTDSRSIGHSQTLMHTDGKEPAAVDGDEATREKLNRITERIIGCAYTVGNTLGCGFLEKVCENALAHELRKAGLKVEQQHPITVWYDGVIVGEFVADLLVEKSVLVELKAAKSIDDAHVAQCLNYLKATGLLLCLLINFGKTKVEVKRLAAPGLIQPRPLEE